MCAYTYTGAYGFLATVFDSYIHIHIHMHRHNVHIYAYTGAYGFLATVFDSFKHHKLSVDVVATSEVSVSLTLNKQVSCLMRCLGGGEAGGSR